MDRNIVIAEPTQETIELGEEIYEAFYGEWKKSKREEVARMLSKGKGYVALLDGAVVGFICYEFDSERRIGEICTNAVSPECRGMGIARKMYDYILSEMRENGIKYVSVQTGLDDGHIPARRAYEKLGFKKNLKSVNYYMEI